MKNIELKREIPVMGEYDVIVAGGGVAGVAAAVSAARMEKRFCLRKRLSALAVLQQSDLLIFLYRCVTDGVQRL